MARSPDAARSLSRLERLLVYHDLLLRDTIRNRAFRRALAARIRPGDSVLDIGAGTGLWSIEAARLGASRVVAVEKEPLLVPLIERAAAENGVADRVRVVRGDSRRIAIPGGKFDVLITETVGNLGFDEGILEIVADARARFLRRGAAVIPEQVSLVAAPAREGWRSPLRARAFRALAVHIPREPGRRRIRVLAPARTLATVRFAGAPGPAPDLDRLRASWRIRDASSIDAFMVWVEMQLAPGVALSTRAGTTWNPALYAVEPPPRGAATVEFRLGLGGKGSHWQLGLRTAGGTTERRYSSLFAYASLAASRPWASQRRR